VLLAPVVQTSLGLTLVLSGAPSYAVASPEAVEFELAVSGRTFRIALHRTVAPTGAGYRAERRTRGGGRTRINSPDLDCLYEGSVYTISQQGSAERSVGDFAAVSTCIHTAGQPAQRTMHGLVQVAGTLWSITPRRDGDASNGVTHALVPVAAHQNGTAAQRTILAEVQAVAPSMPRTQALQSPDETMYVEVYAFSDTTRVAQQGGEAAALADTIAAASAMNRVFAETSLSPRVRFVLVGQDVFEEDPFTVSMVGGGEVDDQVLLSSFNAWAGAEPLPPHDSHVLFSGLDFAGFTVGLAPLGAMCSGPDSGVIIQASPDLEGAVPFIGVHEIGHTLSMNHDGDNGCPVGSLIMSASLDTYNVQAEFSSCSQEEWSQFHTYGEASCLADVPDEVLVDTCGDGVRSGNEECDCGAGDCTGIDPCCEGSTCTLVTGAVCSDFNDACCVSCEVAPADTECRAARDSCDFAEVCTGASAACPGDLFGPGGVACTDSIDNPGYCHAGSCVARDTICMVEGRQFGGGLTGPSAACEYFLGCDQLLCEDPTTCVYLPLPTPDGAVCGDGQVCMSGQCVDAGTLDDCPEDPEKDAPGHCGCGIPDDDADGDGVYDCEDACMADSQRCVPDDSGDVSSTGADEGSASTSTSGGTSSTGTTDEGGTTAESEGTSTTTGTTSSGTASTSSSTGVDASETGSSNESGKDDEDDDSSTVRVGCSCDAGGGRGPSGALWLLGLFALRRRSRGGRRMVLR